MRIVFGKSWFRAKKRLTEIWTPEKAENAHRIRQPYVALIERAGRPECFIEFNGDYVGVGFLDEQSRESLSYQFQLLEPGKLFLTMATYRSFSADSDVVETGTTYFFQPNGNVAIEEEDLRTSSRSVRNTTSNLLGNWEAYPAFSDYESIVRRERGDRCP